MNTIKYTALGQNRIDYIVFHNIEKATSFLCQEGYEPPKDPEDIADAIKELVREKGTTIIKSLLAIHPDKDAILEIACDKTLCSTCKNKLPNKKTCSCQKAEDNFIDTPVSDKERLQMLIKKHKQGKADKDLEEEIESLFGTINTKKDTEDQKENTGILTKKELFIYTGIFCSGLLIGIVCTYTKNRS